MTLIRTPTNILVNGSFLRVRDPNAASGTLFADYVTVPGLANFTLPAETGSTTETALMDGSISAPQFKGVGTITGSIGARGGHPAHQFLEQRSIDQNDIQVQIVQFATNVRPEGFTVAGPETLVASSADDQIDLSEVYSDARASVRVGHVISIGADGASADASSVPGASATLHTYGQSAQGRDGWRFVVAVDDNESARTLMVKVAPAYSAAVEVAGSMYAKVGLRNPGVRWEGVTCRVNQFDQGDFQAGGNVASNFTFTPASLMPAAVVEHRLQTDVDFTQ